MAAPGVALVMVTVVEPKNVPPLGAIDGVATVPKIGAALASVDCALSPLALTADTL